MRGGSSSGAHRGDGIYDGEGGRGGGRPAAPFRSRVAVGMSLQATSKRLNHDEGHVTVYSIAPERYINEYTAVYIYPSKVWRMVSFEHEWRHVDFYSLARAFAPRSRVRAECTLSIVK